jgi:hypothetical protein
LERCAGVAALRQVLLAGAVALCAGVTLVLCLPEQWVSATDWSGRRQDTSGAAGRGTVALSRSGDDLRAGAANRALSADLSDSVGPEAAADGGAEEAPSAVDPTASGLGGADRRTSSRPGLGGSKFGFDFFAHLGGRAPSAPPEGSFKDYFPDGGVAVDGFYENGQRQGEWAGYYPDGSLRLEGQYVDNRREGKWKAYHPSGELMGEGHFNGGFREGTWVLYYSNGLLKENGVFEHDLRHGPWQYYDGFGQLEARSGFYRHGRML